MFATYLRRELGNRRRQTFVVAIGLALAVALVMIVSSIAAGVRDAQAAALESVYGVGTDITITQAAEPPAEGELPGGPQFAFGSGDGATTDGTTTLSQSRLETGRGTTTFDASAVDTALGTDGVAAAAGSLSLTNTTFSGEIPDFTQQQQSGGDGTGQAGAPPQGGPDGAGGSQFGVESVTVDGVDVDRTAIGPLSATALVEGRTLDAADAGALVAVLDEDYATSSALAVGDTIDLGGEHVEIVGIVASTSATGTSAANVFIPLDTAQTLAGLDGQVSTVTVQAESADSIPAVQAALETALPDATVNTQAELAESVSGSLSTASALVANLGTWLSVIVLGAAFLIAILFTVSGVARRTREFGTLKAIGWSNGRIVGQVAGESFVTGALGAIGGVVVGLAGIALVNALGPTISVAGSTTAQGPGGGFPGGDGAAMGGMGGTVASTTTDIVLQAPLTVGVVLIAVGLAVLGGVLAGVVGGWRAARLRPAEALRTIA